MTTESNVINDSSSNENATEMFTRTASSNNISQNLLMENEHMINCGSECSVVNTACSAAADNTVILGMNTLFYVLILKLFCSIKNVIIIVFFLRSCSRRIWFIEQQWESRIYGNFWCKCRKSL